MVKANLGGSSSIDLDVLLRTRLLIQANSGGGKSWTIRRLVEQSFGKVQIILIDPEGEFATLRERFGFALLGKGGELSGDVRHAEFISQKILEFNIPTVCDLFEMKTLDRAVWVKNFLNGLLNAPKGLWKPVLIIVDEAHKFCPERGKGEADSTEAMLDLATKGRKRGFCAVFATQRLGKLNKDAAAELLNVLIGRTFLDIDRDRGAEILGIQKGASRQQFDETVRNLSEGQFYSLGPALTTKPELIKIGPVQTSHPESGMGMKSAVPPPTPEQVKKLIPKLADLPKQAEDKARTEKELREEIRSLKAQVSARKAEAPDPEIQGKVIEKSVQQALSTERRAHASFVSQLRATVEALMKVVVQIKATGFTDASFAQDKVQALFESLSKQIVKLAEDKLAEKNKKWEALQRQAETALRKAHDVLGQEEQINVSIEVVKNQPFSVSKKATVEAPKEVVSTNGEAPTGLSKRILDSLADLEAMDKTPAPRTLVAALCSVSSEAGYFNNTVGKLRTRGYIDYPQDGTIELTPIGRGLAAASDTDWNNEEVLNHALKVCPGLKGKILRVVCDRYPGAVTREEVAEACGVSAEAGYFNNTVGSLRTSSFIDYPEKGKIVAASWMFIDQN